MNVCHELLSSVSRHQTKHKLPCPVLAYPNCHKDGHFLVHVDGKKRIIFLSCSVCDKPISIINLKTRLNKNMKLKGQDDLQTK